MAVTGVISKERRRETDNGLTGTTQTALGHHTAVNVKLVNNLITKEKNILITLKKAGEICQHALHLFALL